MGDLAHGVPEYTAAAVAAVVAAVALDLGVLRTRLLGRPRYWVALAIVLSFQVPVDGWLTRPAATIVHYDPAQILGVRVLGTFPVEDFAFGFALVTLTLAVWHRLGDVGRGRARPAADVSPQVDAPPRADATVAETNPVGHRHD